MHYTYKTYKHTCLKNMVSRCARVGWLLYCAECSGRSSISCQSEPVSDEWSVAVSLRISFQASISSSFS